MRRIPSFMARMSGGLAFSSGRTVALALALACLGASAASSQDAPPDVQAGMRVFAKCRACHRIGEGATNQIGPVLNGVVGRHSGTYPGYAYSSANKASGMVWDEPTLRKYLRNPKAMIPGTKMMFAGITSDKDLDNLIAYLRQFDASGKIKAP